MFGDKKISLDKDLWERVKRFAALAGYSSPDEFVAHVLEKELAGLKATDSDENIRKKLKGLGPKGKVINQIQDDTGAQISLEDDGTVYVGADNGDAAEAARDAINAIANPTMPEVGERYLGTVVKTVDFGAFVSLLPGRDGLLHISKLRELNDGKRVEKVEDVVSVGQKIQVEIAELGDRGKLSLIPVLGDVADAPAEETADDEAEAEVGADA